MLSNPNSGLQQRQRQHRRQNSTPTAFSIPKVPILPASVSAKRHGPHQRGYSVDQHAIYQQQQQHQHQQGHDEDDNTVSSTNPGFQQHPQHILREAQQQRLARPGQQTPLNLSSTFNEKAGPFEFFDTSFNDSQELNENPTSADIAENHTHLNNHENLYSNFHNLQQKRTAQETEGQTGWAGKGHSPPAAQFERSQEPQYGSNQHQQAMADMLATTSTKHFGTEPSFQKSAVSQSTLIMGPNRPVTPPNQTRSGLPMTPETTPFRRSTQQSNSLASPSSHEKATSLGDLRNEALAAPEELFRQPSSGPESLPSPPNSAQMTYSTSYDTAPMPNPSDFMNDLAMGINFPAYEQEYDSSCGSPLSMAFSPSQSSILSSPEMGQAILHSNPLATAPDFDAPGKKSVLPSSDGAGKLDEINKSANGSLSPQAMSIADLSLNATIEDTGITMDDIATFIEGPDASDGKWVCSYPECGKRFGRKENIKSHVQTHLGDRQFRCNHCKKCFVRQHDLKRHSKIHSGVKPYPCACGNSFARHDALTRHRQRGMCVGAFQGIVKKVSKRGRPRKARPEGDARRDKAHRSRQRAIAMSATSSSSGISQYSPASYQESPSLTHESYSSRATSPRDFFSQDISTTDFAKIPSGMFAYTPPTSPGNTAESFISPQQTQSPKKTQPQDVAHSPAASIEPVSKRNSAYEMLESVPELESYPQSPSNKAASSNHGTPPGLCLTSSSPPAMNLFDLEGATGDARIDQFGTDATNDGNLQGAFDFRIPGIDDDSNNGSDAGMFFNLSDYDSQSGAGNTKNSSLWDDFSNQANLFEQDPTAAFFM